MKTKGVIGLISYFFALALVDPREAWRQASNLRNDLAGAFDVGTFVGLVIGVIVLIIIVASLMGTLKTNLTKYAANETTFGPTMQTLVPLLIGVGIILTLVFVLLRRQDV